MEETKRIEQQRYMSKNKMTMKYFIQLYDDVMFRIYV